MNITNMCLVVDHYGSITPVYALRCSFLYNHNTTQYCVYTIHCFPIYIHINGTHPQHTYMQEPSFYLPRLGSGHDVSLTPAGWALFSPRPNYIHCCGYSVLQIPLRAALKLGYVILPIFGPLISVTTPAYYSILLPYL